MPESREKARDRSAKWRADNPDRSRLASASWRSENQATYREYHWRKKGVPVTWEQYVALLEKQGGRCAICHGPPTRRVLVPDHDHSTGKLRGLLCDTCNHGLGKFKDSPDILLSALAYLRGV